MVELWPAVLHEKDLKEHLIILSSYSGNTEETLDAFAVARAKHLATVVVAAGRKTDPLGAEVRCAVR